MCMSPLQLGLVIGAGKKAAEGLTPSDFLREAKVDKLEVSFRVYEDVFRLQVAVRHSLDIV